ncbi:MAG: hypothetical protein QFF03_21130, partial [Pseudomonadota bacterium]|nr:hypothetical protein [Pseudomonadota bacterium]
LGAALGAACLLGCAGSAAARDGVANAVSEKVQVESHNGKVLVRLTIDNQSDATVYVPRAVATAPLLLGARFEVRDSANGDPIEYVGPVVRPLPLGKADFLAVRPHTRHRNTIDITGAYAFMAGRHTYQLSYAGSYLADVSRLELYTPVEPDAVLFAFIGK